MKNLTLGIEIECIFNQDLIPLDIGDYHDGIINDYLPSWYVESDGSLYPNTEAVFIESARCCELVSKKLKTKNAFNKALKEIYNHFGESGLYELNKVLCFNKSCGCHVHFSIENFKFTEKCVLDCFFKARRYFRNRIRKSLILSDNTKKSILTHYYRHYARKIKRDSYNHRGEFYFLSERYNRGLEWRSLNLRGVKTWEEFFEAMKIFYESIVYLSNLSQDYTIESKIIIKNDSLKEIKKDDLIYFNSGFNEGRIINSAVIV